MKYINNSWLFHADMGGGEGGGGGGDVSPGGDAGLTRGEAAFEPVPKSTTGDQPLPGKVPAQTGPKPEGGEGAPAAGGFDASKFAKEFGASLSESLKPVLQPKEPEMTQEEARKLLNIWEPDDNWYRNYDNLETRAEAIGQMRDALIKQADTLAQFRMQEMVDKLREEIMPGLQTVSQTANQQREERFRTTYPQLGEPAMQPLIRAIAQDMVDKGQTFNNENELFKAIATGVEAVIKVGNPEFTLTAASNGDQQQNQGRGGRNLPVLSPGGGGSTGRRGGGSGSDKPKGLAIFDK